MVRAKLIIEGKEINVLWFHFGFNQGADVTGRPSQKPVFTGLKLIIESQKDLNLADWAFTSNQTKQIELHIYPVIMGKKTRKLYFYDCHLVNWKNAFSSIGSSPMSETLEITCAGVEVTSSNAVYNATWRVTYPQQESETTVLENNEPNLIEYHLEDLENNEVNLEGIEPEEEFYIVIKSKYAEGETMSINLEDKSKDYEYNGKYMKDDIITGIVINGDFTKVKVKAIEEQQK